MDGCLFYQQHNREKMNNTMRNKWFKNVYLPIEHQGAYFILLCAYYSALSLIILFGFYWFEHQHYTNFLDFLAQRKNAIFFSGLCGIVLLYFNRGLQLQPRLPQFLYRYVLKTELYQDWLYPQPITSNAEILDYTCVPGNFFNPALSRILIQLPESPAPIWFEAQLSALFFQHTQNKSISTDLKWRPQQQVNLTYLPHSRTIISLSACDESNLQQLMFFVSTPLEFNEIPSLFLQHFQYINKIEARRPDGEYSYSFVISTSTDLTFQLSASLPAFKQLESLLAHKINFFTYQEFKQNCQQTSACLYPKH